MAITFYHIVFGGLGCLIAVLAWMGSSAGNYGQALFGIIPLPNIIPVLGAEKSVLFTSLHKELVPFFIGLLIIHIVSVIFHVFILRDNTLKAMWFGKT